MKRLFIAFAALSLSVSGLQLHAQNSRYRHILLRDFRTVWQGEVINYNIGTAAHCPGTLSSLRRSLPDDVQNH